MKPSNPLPLLSSFQLPPNLSEAISLEGKFIEIPEEVRLVIIEYPNPQLSAWIQKIGTVELWLALALGKVQSTKSLMETRWILRKEAEQISPYEDCPISFYHPIMNIIS